MNLDRRKILPALATSLLLTGSSPYKEPFGELTRPELSRANESSDFANKKISEKEKYEHQEAKEFLKDRLKIVLANTQLRSSYRGYSDFYHSYMRTYDYAHNTLGSLEISLLSELSSRKDPKFTLAVKEVDSFMKTTNYKFVEALQVAFVEILLENYKVESFQGAVRLEYIKSELRSFASDVTVGNPVIKQELFDSETLKRFLTKNRNEINPGELKKYLQLVHDRQFVKKIYEEEILGDKVNTIDEVLEKCQEVGITSVHYHYKLTQSRIDGEAMEIFEKIERLLYTQDAESLKLLGVRTKDFEIAPGDKIFLDKLKNARREVVLYLRLINKRSDDLINQRAFANQISVKSIIEKLGVSLFRSIAHILNRTEFGSNSKLQDFFKMLFFLIENDYPENSIIKIMSKFERLSGFNYDSANELWSAFGRKYTKSTSQLPQIWKKVPYAQSAFDLKKQIEDDRDDLLGYNNLRNIDISDPYRYVRLFQFISNTYSNGVVQRMLESANYNDVNERIQKAESKAAVLKVIDQALIFGQIVDTSFERKMLLEIFSEKNIVTSKYIREIYESIIDSTGTIHIKLDNLRYVNSFLESFNQSGEKKDFPGKKIKIYEDSLSEVKTLQQWADVSKLINLITIGTQHNGGIRTPLNNSVQLVELENLEEIKRLKTIMSERFKEIIKHDQSINFENTNTIEMIRSSLNENSRGSGNNFLIEGASQHIEKIAHSKDVDQLINFGEKYFSFAEKIKNDSKLGKDISGMYEMIGNFSISVAEELLLSRKEDELSESQKTNYSNKLGQYGVDIFNEQSKGKKLAAHILSGNFQYVGSKLGKLDRKENFDFGEIIRSNFSEPVLQGVSIEYIAVRGANATEKDSYALLMTFPQEKARVTLLSNTGGIVSEEQITNGQVSIKAPVSFSTGNRHQTDIAIYNGQMINRLIRTNANDGLLVTDSTGKLFVFDKRSMTRDELKKLGLGVSEEEFGKPFLITKNMRDYSEFLKLAEEKKLSVLSNMMLAKNGQQIFVNADGKDVRRLFVIMGNGDIGIFNSMKPMSTNEAVALAIKLGVKTAIYMDTGMYNDGSINFPSGKSYRLGSGQADKPTNLIGIRID